MSLAADAFVFFFLQEYVTNGIIPVLFICQIVDMSLVLMMTSICYFLIIGK
jgi:hypothetical protein